MYQRRRQRPRAFEATRSKLARTCKKYFVNIFLAALRLQCVIIQMEIFVTTCLFEQKIVPLTGYIFRILCLGKIRYGSLPLRLSTSSLFRGALSVCDKNVQYQAYRTSDTDKEKENCLNIL